MANNDALLPAALAKESILQILLRQYDSLLIAYSGGVDSTYLADVAHEVLGQKVHLVTADSPSIPRTELQAAVALAQERGWQLTVILTREFEDEQYLRNDALRCYHCKTGLFSELKKYARTQGITHIAHGELADDAQDTTRVGVRAAHEQGAVAPLAEAGLTKEEVRVLSQRRRLPTWDKASFACLSSRFPKDTPITPETMRQVEEAEELLKRLGFRQYRVRHHGTLCRIEVDPADFPHIIEPATRRTVVQHMLSLGYRHVSLDLVGYRTGSTAG